MHDYKINTTVPNGPYFHYVYIAFYIHGKRRSSLLESEMDGRTILKIDVK